MILSSLFLFFSFSTFQAIRRYKSTALHSLQMFSIRFFFLQRSASCYFHWIEKVSSIVKFFQHLSTFIGGTPQSWPHYMDIYILEHKFMTNVGVTVACGPCCRCVRCECMSEGSIRFVQLIFGRLKLVNAFIFALRSSHLGILLMRSGVQRNDSHINSFNHQWERRP